jgi:hypothetical protein
MKKAQMKTATCVLKVSLAVAIFAGVASANVYDFDYSGTYFTATGTLDVNASGVATAGSGNLTYGTTTTAITLYQIDNPPSGVINARTAGGTDLIGLDNQVYTPPGPLLDTDGLIFWIGNTPPTAGLVYRFSKI